MVVYLFLPCESNLIIKDSLETLIVHGSAQELYTEKFY